VGGEPAVVAVCHRNGAKGFDVHRDGALARSPKPEARGVRAYQRCPERKRAGERGRHCGGTSWVAPRRTALRARTSTLLPAMGASDISGLALSTRMRAGMIGSGKRNWISSAEGLRHRVTIAILPPPEKPARRNMITRCSGSFHASGEIGSPHSLNQAISLTPGA